jgi:hypothetical protein
MGDLERQGERRRVPTALDGNDSLARDSKGCGDLDLGQTPLGTKLADSVLHMVKVTGD